MGRKSQKKQKMRDESGEKKGKETRERKNRKTTTGNPGTCMQLGSETPGQRWALHLPACRMLATAGFPSVPVSTRVFLSAAAPTSKSGSLAPLVLHSQKEEMVAGTAKPFSATPQRLSLEREAPAQAHRTSGWEPHHPPAGLLEFSKTGAVHGWGEAPSTGKGKNRTSC